MQGWILYILLSCHTAIHLWKQISSRKKASSAAKKAQFLTRMSTYIIWLKRKNERSEIYGPPPPPIKVATKLPNSYKKQVIVT